MGPRFHETTHRPTAPEQPARRPSHGIPAVPKNTAPEAQGLDQSAPTLLSTTYPLNHSHSKILIAGLHVTTYEPTFHIFNNRGLHTGVNLSANETANLLSSDISTEIEQHFEASPLPSNSRAVSLSGNYGIVFGGIQTSPIVSIISRHNAVNAVQLGRASWDTLRNLRNVIEINVRQLACYYQHITSWTMEFLSLMKNEDDIGEIIHPDAQPILETELMDIYMALNDYTFQQRAKSVLQKHYHDINDVIAGQFVSEMIALYPGKLMSMWITNISLNM